MKQIMIAAMGSGSGKTIFSCGLMRAFDRRGMRVAGFKCGPDYIDPMFHTRVLGIPSRNLDLFLQGKEGVRRTLAGQEADLAVLEGAMGFYDGIGGTTDASAWDIAVTTDVPVILVLRPKGQSVTLAAQVMGLMRFRQESHIRGLVLTDCRPSLYMHLAGILQRETGLPVLGYLPPMEEAVIGSRHLGLVDPGEVAGLISRFDRIAGTLEKTLDLDTLWRIAKDVKTEREESRRTEAQREKARETDLPGRCRIAVARDEAFSFYYEDNLDALRAAGAELVFFSPLRDDRLPEADGLYLGGGYPEMYIRELSANREMRESVSFALHDGMPAVAECGGFLYLQSALRDEEGQEWPMAGVLPGVGYRTDSLRRFGYLTLQAQDDSLLFRKGEKNPAHEFHYWDSTDCGKDIMAQKPSGSTWRCGFLSPHLYAAFPHLHFGGEIPLASRFTRAAGEYHRRLESRE